jgi:hypothetical protein
MYTYLRVAIESVLKVFRLFSYPHHVQCRLESEEEELLTMVYFLYKSHGTKATVIIVPSPLGYSTTGCGSACRNPEYLSRDTALVSGLWKHR